MRPYPLLFTMVFGLFFASGFNLVNGQSQTGYIDNLPACNDRVRTLYSENRILRDSILFLTMELQQKEAEYIRQLNGEGGNVNTSLSHHPKTSRSSISAPPSPTPSYSNPAPANSRTAELQELKAELRMELFKGKPTLAHSFSFSGKWYDAYVADLNKEHNLQVKFYYKDKSGGRYYSFENVKKQNPDHFIFATNGGMYDPQFDPQGLLVQEGDELKKLDKRKKGFGNFYMQPNGIFLIDSLGNPYVVRTANYYDLEPIAWYATQSGPMLVHEGQINQKFTPGSKNLRIRSGVGVDVNGLVVFLISRQAVNFYDFAQVFRDVFDCKNALFLDGEISRVYCPELGYTNPNFGHYATIIGIMQERE